MQHLSVGVTGWLEGLWRCGAGACPGDSALQSTVNVSCVDLNVFSAVILLSSFPSTSSLTPLPVVGLQSRAVAATCNGVFPFRYASFETFALDVRLVFDNCETFNEDDSDIGRAGHRMRKYFEKKWTDTFKVS